MGRIYWYMYTFLVAIMLYWLSNLILWYPWGKDPLLGMILMLTVNPVIWGVGEYACLSRFPGKSKWRSVWAVVLIMLGVSFVSDYLFFDLCLHSADVWHPTTFYGYGFVAILPLLIRWLFRRRLAITTKNINKRHMGNLVGLDIVIIFIFIFFVFVL